MQSFKNKVKDLARLLSAAVLMSSLGTAHAVTNGATWSSGSAATLPLLGGGSSTITVTGATGNGNINLSNITDFGCALGASASILAYNVNSSWTANFTTGVPNLLLYIVGWRGNSSAASGGTTTFAFASSGNPITPTIVSGLTGTPNGSIAGGVLSIGTTGFYNGILRFPGTISNLMVMTNATGTSAQALTFGVSDDSSCAPAPAVSAPIDLNFNKKVETFATEVEVK